MKTNIYCIATIASFLGEWTPQKVHGTYWLREWVNSYLESVIISALIISMLGWKNKEKFFLNFDSE